MKHDVPYTMRLMNFERNSFGASAIMAWRVVGPVLALGIVSTFSLLHRLRSDARMVLVVSWFVLAFVLPASMPFIFPRFFGGLIVPSTLLTAFGLRVWGGQGLANLRRAE